MYWSDFILSYKSAQSYIDLNTFFRLAVLYIEIPVTELQASWLIVVLINHEQEN